MGPHSRRTPWTLSALPLPNGLKHGACVTFVCTGCENGSRMSTGELPAAETLTLISIPSVSAVRCARTGHFAGCDLTQCHREHRKEAWGRRGRIEVLAARKVPEGESGELMLRPALPVVKVWGTRPTVHWI